MNLSTGAEICVCENWNSINPSMVSIGELESNQRQFWDWETNTNTPTRTTNTINNNPFINPTTNIFDCTTLSSSSSSTFSAGNFIPYSQFSNYSSAGFLKKEEGIIEADGGSCGGSGRIGLNLGHRTYFSSRETAVMDRLFRRPRGFYQTNQVPRCQAEGCMIDLTNAKHYHRRHKVCDFHSKATKVLAGGLEQRFCQQCSRFHVLTEFDEAKRSCRKRLADHNRRRRKPQQPGSSDPVPAKTAGNASFSQVGSLASILELKETSLSSSNLPFMISKSTNNTTTTTTDASSSVEGPAAMSLGGEHRQIFYTSTPQRPFFFNNESVTLFQGENSASPYHNLFFSNSNEA